MLKQTKHAYIVYIETALKHADIVYSIYINWLLKKVYALCYT